MISSILSPSAGASGAFVSNEGDILPSPSFSSLVGCTFSSDSGSTGVIPLCPAGSSSPCLEDSPFTFTDGISAVAVAAEVSVASGSSVFTTFGGAAIT